MANIPQLNDRSKNRFRNVMADIINNRQLYFMLLPVVGAIFFRPQRHIDEPAQA